MPWKHKTHHAALPFLEQNHKIGQDVAHVDLFPTPQHLGVSLLHQLSDVREEESAARVVRVRVCIAEPVVDPMVSDPVEDRVL